MMRGVVVVFVFFFFKQKTAYEMRISDWSSDVCSSDLVEAWSHGGGAPWQSASFDPESNTIIVGAGNPGPWNTWARTSKDGNPHDFDSLYTSGQVGVDPSTGEVKWFYQQKPNDDWDFSGNNELVLFATKDKNDKANKATDHPQHPRSLNMGARNQRQ